MPTTKYSNFDETISILFKYKDIALKKEDSSATRSKNENKWDEYKTRFNYCETFIAEEYKKLKDNIQKGSCDIIPMDANEDFTILEETLDWKDRAEKLQEFYQTTLAECLDPLLKYAKLCLQTYLQELESSFLLSKLIQKLYKIDENFNNKWQNKIELNKKEIFLKIISAYQDYLSNDKLNHNILKEEAFLNALKVSVKLDEIFKQYESKEDFSPNYLFRFLKLLFFSLEDSNVKKIEAIFEFTLHTIAHCRSVTPSEALNQLTIFGMDKPYSTENKQWTIDHFAKRLQVVQKIDELADLKANETAYHYDCLNMNEQVYLVYDKNPQLYWIFNKYKFLYSHLYYSDSDNLVKLFELFEAISPNDVKELMLPILYKWIKLTPERAEKLIALLGWIRDSIQKDNSPFNKERMSGFTDRIIALLYDNPSLADEIFTLPPQKYASLCDMLQSKFNFETLKTSYFADLFREDKSRLIEIYCFKLEKMIDRDTSLLKPIYSWLNIVLKLNDEQFDSTHKISLKNQLEQLPRAYLHLIQSMIDVTQSQPQLVKVFLSLANAWPYCHALQSYLNKLREIPTQAMQEVMEIFNELVSENPEWMSQLLSNIQHLSLLKNLRQIDIELFKYLMTAHKNILNADHLNKIIQDKKLREKLLVLKEIEENHGISLISIFFQNEKSLLIYYDVLLEIIINNPKFAFQFSVAFSDKFHHFKWKQAEILSLINQMLMLSPQLIIDLFEVTLNSNKALDKILEEAVDKRHLFIKNSSDENKLQTLLCQLIEFYNTFKYIKPNYAPVIVWLIENSQDKLAKKILDKYKNENLIPYLDNIIELIQAQYLAECENLIDKIVNDPNDHFTQKLITIASRNCGSLISQCLSLDPVVDKEIYNFFIKYPVEKLISTEFVRLMLSRKQCDLLDFSKDISVKNDRRKTSFVDKQSLENTMLSLMNESEIASMTGNELTNQQRLKLTLGMAKSLITQDGLLDIDVINHIKQTTIYTNLKFSPFLKQHIDNIFTHLQNNSKFNERLQSQLAPEPFSRSELIIEKMLNLSPDQPITAYHAKIVVLGTLLYPIRQDSVGSCFSTSVVIQAASSVDGLLQLLEDYMSLLAKGSLSRCTRYKKNITEYPMLFNFDEFAKTFATDNLLSRAYEFIVAGMSVNSEKEDYSLKISTTGLLKSIFQQEVNLHTRSRLKDIANEKKLKIENDISTALSNHINDSCVLSYSGHVKHNYNNEQGAWLLLEKDSLQPLNSNKELQLSFYNKIFHKVKLELMKQHDEFEELFTEIFDRKLVEYVKSNEFQKQLLASAYSYNSNNKGLARLNAAKYNHLTNKTPYAEFCGGHADAALSNYYCKPVINEKLPFGYNPFMILETMMARLPAKNELMTVSNGSHAFNLNLSKIKLISKKGATLISRELNEQAIHLSKTKLTEQLAKNIIDDYVDYQEYPDSDARSLHKKMLLRHLQRYVCLQDLTSYIAQTDRELIGEQRDSVGRVLDWAIRSRSEFKDLLPTIYIIADTNWEGTPNLGLSCHVHDRSIQYVFTSAAGEVRRINWSPKNLWTWGVHRYSDGSDELSRTYFRP